MSSCRLRLVVLSIVYTQKSTLFFESELLRQPCWLALHQWRAKKGCTWSGWYFCHPVMSPLFVTSLIRSARHKWQHPRSCLGDFQTSTFNKQDQKWSKNLLCVYCFPSIPIDGTCNVSSVPVPSKCNTPASSLQQLGVIQKLRMSFKSHLSFSLCPVPDSALNNLWTVSYTHLTLPTRRTV